MSDAISAVIHPAGTRHISFTRENRSDEIPESFENTGIDGDKSASP